MVELPADHPITLRDRLQWILDNRRVSARELSRRAGLAEPHVALIMRRAASRDIRLAQLTLVSIAQAADVSLTWLATGRGDPDSVEGAGSRPVPSAPGGGTDPAPPAPTEPHRASALDVGRVATGDLETACELIRIVRGEVDAVRFREEFMALLRRTRRG